MPFQSEIRPSQINELIEKVQNNNYGKFLKKVTITARSFQDKSMVFNFPVTAIVGINGGGKTTVLGAAACAYKTIKPSLFFTKSGRFNSSMQNWKFEYELIDKKIKPSDAIRRSAKFTNSKWTRNSLERQNVILTYFLISFGLRQYQIKYIQFFGIHQIFIAKLLLSHLF